MSSSPKPPSAADRLQRAMALHQSGDLGGAQALYEALLRREPRHFDAMHLLGLALVQAGALERGADRIGQAIRIRSDFPEAHYNLGHALLSLGRAQEALESFDRAIALNPSEPLYHFERGNALRELERWTEALASFAQAARLAPRYAEAYNNMGTVLKDEGRFAEAVAQYDRAVALRPSYAEAHSNRGNALKELERYGEALACYDRAIALKPDYAEAYSNRGNALARLGRHEDALANHDKAIALRPSYAEGHNNRGNALKELGRQEEALASFDRAIALKPDYAEAYSNRAGALEQQGRLQEALASHDKAIGLKPESAEAWCARGNTLADMERLDEALGNYDRAIAFKPGFALARYNKSLLLLRRRELAEGFALYRERWAAERPGGRGPETKIAAWDGGRLDGELLLWAEQGLGDEVFFASFLGLLDPALKVALSADVRLHPALARAYPALRLIDRRKTATAIDGNFAAQAPVGDLGHLLRLDAGTIASRGASFLTADAVRRARVQQENALSGKRAVCGLSWRSGNTKVGPLRSVKLADFAQLLAMPGLTFVNLQYGEVTEEIAAAAQSGSDVQMARGVDLFGDIEGVLALIDLCDVVFTIDNVTAHLAGALGKPAVVLVPAGHGRHWYWGGESPSLWYPSLRPVYQQQAGSWAAPIAAAVRLLGELIPGARTRA